MTRGARHVSGLARPRSGSMYSRPHAQMLATGTALGATRTTAACEEPVHDRGPRRIVCVRCAVPWPRLLRPVVRSVERRVRLTGFCPAPTRRVILFDSRF